jgi:hypothetical protein
MTEKLAELFDEKVEAEPRRAPQKPQRRKPDAWSRASATFLDPAPGGRR